MNFLLYCLTHCPYSACHEERFKGRFYDYPPSSPTLEKVNHNRNKSMLRMEQMSSKLLMTHPSNGLKSVFSDKKSLTPSLIKVRYECLSVSDFDLYYILSRTKFRSVLISGRGGRKLRVRKLVHRKFGTAQNFINLR